MKFLIDAQLPRSLCALLVRCGHDAVNTLDLPAANLTKDKIINRISLSELRVVVTKDTDFFHSHMLQGRPWKLVLIKTGNISTKDLCVLIEKNLDAIVTALYMHTLVEIDRSVVNPVA